ncbi:hypothetical protein UAS_00563 [Enterococcus asini ATCC 700915]|uniref:Uncharacterized protein n=1 Tax=Enterococcus asini ATCC 700915 TaxID=1158606 RepID=R2SML1_9ENTE|nr:hypothetical protein [Enterococcus asini]EOH89449.1 hypothetical protein UAS_00563 [Enterococcus asini ATCC 700915]EOT56532.1 hypothetical protein I579_00031 [Enterococcus asini ATCC 700915]
MIGVRKKALTIPPTKANVKGYHNGNLQPFFLNSMITENGGKHHENSKINK